MSDETQKPPVTDAPVTEVVQPATEKPKRARTGKVGATRVQTARKEARKLKHPQKRSAEKGGTFERDLNTRLSLWISDGEHRDLFRRAVMSGGQFTNADRDGATGTKLPGDVAAAHPLAFALVNLFAIEAKNRKDIGLRVYMVDTKGTSFLAQTIEKTRLQATRHGVAWMVVAKEDRQPSLVFMPSSIGMLSIRPSQNGMHENMRHHMLDGGRIFMATLDDFLSHTHPKQFLAAVTALLSSWPQWKAPLTIGAMPATEPKIKRRQLIIEPVPGVIADVPFKRRKLIQHEAA